MERYIYRKVSPSRGFMVVQGNVPYLSLYALCGLCVRPDDAWKRGGGALWEGCAPTQRGVGIDHLDKVQQKSVQIEIFRAPWAIVTHLVTSAN